MIERTVAPSACEGSLLGAFQVRLSSQTEVKLFSSIKAVAVVGELRPDGALFASVNAVITTAVAGVCEGGFRRYRPQRPPEVFCDGTRLPGAGLVTGRVAWWRITRVRLVGSVVQDFRSIPVVATVAPMACGDNRWLDQKNASTRTGVVTISVSPWFRW